MVTSIKIDISQIICHPFYKPIGAISFARLHVAHEDIPVGLAITIDFS